MNECDEGESFSFFNEWILWADENSGDFVNKHITKKQLIYLDLRLFDPWQKWTKNYSPKWWWKMAMNPMVKSKNKNTQQIQV